MPEGTVADYSAKNSVYRPLDLTKNGVYGAENTATNLVMFRFFFFFDVFMGGGVYWFYFSENSN